MNHLSHDEVTTRKPHACWGCTEKLPPGTKMHRVVTKDDGLVTTYWCDPCQQFINEACKRDQYLARYGFEFGYVKEAREEMRRQESRP